MIFVIFLPDFAHFYIFPAKRHIFFPVFAHFCISPHLPASPLSKTFISLAHPCSWKIFMCWMREGGGTVSPPTPVEMCCFPWYRDCATSPFIHGHTRGCMARTSPPHPFVAWQGTPCAALEPVNPAVIFAQLLDSTQVPPSLGEGQRSFVVVYSILMCRRDA